MKRSDRLESPSLGGVGRVDFHCLPSQGELPGVDSTSNNDHSELVLVPRAVLFRLEPRQLKSLQHYLAVLIDGFLPSIVASS